MFYKTYESRYGLVVAACDEDVSGKILKMNDGTEFFVNPRFYGDQKIQGEDLLKVFTNCVNGNLVGKETVGLAKKAGLITDANIVNLNGVPHAQFFVMKI